MSATRPTTEESLATLDDLADGLKSLKVLAAFEPHIANLRAALDRPPPTSDSANKLTEAVDSLEREAHCHEQCWKCGGSEGWHKDECDWGVLRAVETQAWIIAVPGFEPPEAPAEPWPEEHVQRMMGKLRALQAENADRPPPTQGEWSRDDLGREVRAAWIEWAKTQPQPKPSWLVPYDQLPEWDKEADRMIGERLRAALATTVGRRMGEAEKDALWRTLERAMPGLRGVERERLHAAIIDGQNTIRDVPAPPPAGEVE